MHSYIDRMDRLLLNLNIVYRICEVLQDMTIA